MKINERSVIAGDLKLAVKTWGDASKPPIIALHGWQDNAATFDKLAPCLPDFYWVAPDLPGHGLSEHRGKSAEYTIWSYCTEVIALADALSLNEFTLLGHSMGGGVSNLLSALFPERINQLVLLDIIGTITTPVTNAIEQMRKGITQRISKSQRKPGLYATEEEAVAARARRGINNEAAALLGSRGIKKSDDGYYWHHDQRLTYKNLLGMCDEQIDPFLQAIACPVMLIMAKEAVQRKETVGKRVAQISNIRMEQLQGGHHQHLDGDVEKIASLIKRFLNEG